jgi:hypothetical protein
MWECLFACARGAPGVSHFCDGAAFFEARAAAALTPEIGWA